MAWEGKEARQVDFLYTGKRRRGKSAASSREKNKGGKGGTWTAKRFQKKDNGKKKWRQSKRGFSNPSGIQRITKINLWFESIRKGKSSVISIDEKEKTIGKEWEEAE